MNRKNYLMKITLFFLLGLLVLFLTAFPLSENQKNEIKQFKSGIAACEVKMDCIHKIEYFDYVVNVVYIDEASRYSFSKKWASLKILPWHLRLIGALRMLGEKGSYWIFFDLSGSSRILPNYPFCFTIYRENPGVIKTIWKKDESIKCFKLVK